ncbi:MAG TPA: 4-(cytidine 5'-diphospho)-2-C-methyl-D-erythritol kinase [Thermoanaerobaculia bacterium]|nr:4-(cytidine 5'-diphospho)-2-C-methyl-D-erythritol kinase [Thermoanaerobaculia bacterium]
MRVRSYAKINWSLRITGRRADGYHDLETLFQSVSLHDVLTFREAATTLLACDDPSIPTDESNLILRAAKRLGAPPVAITLEKRIPAGGGLGGGSSNAAAALRALDRMFDLHTPPQTLHEHALALGSDVPFFLAGGTAYATGRGEALTPLPAVAPVPLLLLLPEERVMTAEAFRMLRGFSQPIGLDRYRAMVDDDLLSHADLLVNDFEGPIFEKLPSLAALKRRLKDAGAAWTAMSGSGSTIAGAFRSQAARDAAAGSFADMRVAVAETIGAAEALNG